MTGSITSRAPVWRGFAFAIGCVALSAGVILHLPMFVTDIMAGRMLMAMAFDAAMLWGMALIAGGTLLAGAALWRPVAHGEAGVVIVPPLAITARHWMLIAALVSVLVVDTMKPATIGFAMPGMSREYGLVRTHIAWFPFSALTGTVIGSVLWGWYADHQGRRAAILLSTLMFIGTSICGAMPSFGWNVAMCFLMGASAGGLLPVAYALLTEMLPTARRGFFLVLVGGLGAAGGFFAASGFATVLEPIFGWRALWLVGLPTGLFVLVLSLWLPESPAYLARVGRLDEAARSVARYGGSLRAVDHPSGDDRTEHVEEGYGRHSITILTMVGVLWGLTNFGFLLWLPTMLADEGVGVEAISELLAASALVAFLVIIPATILYHRLGGAGALVIALGTIALGLGWIALAGAVTGGVLLLLVGVNAVIAMLLPFAAECAPSKTRGRAVGFVAAGSKAGGLLAQGATLAGFTPSAEAATLVILAPVVVLIGIMARQRMRITRRSAASVTA